jgi:hypothetical protein
MKFFAFYLVLVSFVSCGQKQNSNSTSITPIAKQETECDLDLCDVIRSDDRVVELLDSMIDVPIEISDDHVKILVSKLSIDQGSSFNCESEASAGEIYDFSLDNNYLNLKIQNENYRLVRLNKDSEGLNGSWTWRGKSDQGVQMIKTFSFIGENRMILKTHCEL